MAVLFSAALLLAGCGGGGSGDADPTQDHTPDPPAPDPGAWVKSEVIQVNTSGLLTPHVRAIPGGDDTLSVAYFEPHESLSGVFRVNYLTWQSDASETAGSPIPDSVVDLDNTRTLSLALDSIDQPVVAYQGGLVKDCGGEDQADAMFSTGQDGTWQEYTGGIGFVARNPVITDGLAGRHVSVALDSQGNIHLCYQFFYEGCDSMNFTYPDLNYVEKAQGSPGAAAPEETVEGKTYYAGGGGIQNNTGGYCSLLIDGDDYPAVFYYAALSDGTRGLRLARKRDGVWEREWVETGFEVGGISSAVDGEGNLAVAYYVVDYVDPATQESSPGCLRFARERLGQPDPWDIEMIDDGTICGSHPSLAFDPSGNPAIAYYETETYSGMALENLKLAAFDGEHWDVDTVSEDGDIGRYNSLWFDASAKPFVCSYSRTDSAIYVFRKP